MIRTIDVLCLLLVLSAGCAALDPRNVEDAAPIGPLASDYQEKVKADLSRSLADPAGAIYRSRRCPASSISASAGPASVTPGMSAAP